MASLTFTIEGAVNTVITVTELEDGSLRFDVVLVANTAEIGDLRGLFFDVSDESLLGTLSVSGTDVTDDAFKEDGVTTLGQDANMNGAVIKEYGSFDVGVEFGTAGIESDDIQSTSFYLSSSAGPLTLDLINLQDFGVRLSSVGEIDGTRDDGLKVGSTATAAPDAVDDQFSIDEDSVAYGWNVLKNDADLDGDTLVVEAVEGDPTKVGQPVTVISSGGTSTTVTILANGNVVFDPRADFGGLGQGETDQITLSYDVYDQNGGRDTATVTITITGNNDAPIITSGPGAGAVTEVADGTAGENTITQILTTEGKASDVAVLSDGSFVVVWGADGASSTNIGGSTSLYVQRFSSEGSPLTEPTLVSSGLTVNIPSVQATADGGYVISAGATDSGLDGVEDRTYFWFTFDAENTLTDGPNRVDPNNSGFGSWSYGSDGLVSVNGYTVAVMHYGNGAWNVGLDVIDENGTKVFQGDVPTDPAGAELYAEATALADEKSVLIVWFDTSAPEDTSGGIFGRVFSTETLSFVTDPFLINQDTVGDEVGRDNVFEADTYALTALDDGGFAVFWHDRTSGEIQARFFGGPETNYAATTDEFIANTTSAGDQHFVDSTLMPNGNVFIVYASVGGDGVTSIFGKEFTATGDVTRDEFLIETTTEPNAKPRVDALSDSEVVVTWNEGLSDQEGPTIKVKTVELNSAVVGTVIKGVDALDLSGWSVSSAGDVDGDGRADVIIGAYGANPDGSSDAGETYLVYGAALDAARKGDGILDLETLSARQGVLIKGVDIDDWSGWSVSSAGDVDGDGLADVLIGAPLADPDGVSWAGETYLVFGSALAAEKSGDGVLDLAALSPTEGVLIKGIDAFDLSGYSVSPAGDVDGDGLADILIGASWADPDSTVDAGETYLIYGSTLAAEKTGDGLLNLATLNSTEGVLIKGIDLDDQSGGSLSSAGDVDGDGLADILVGALGAGSAGETYLVYGSALAAEKTGDGLLDLASLSASQGVLIKGIDLGDTSGHSVSSAGDVDGDGLGDILIGAYESDPDGASSAGETYLVYGSALAAEKGGDGVLDLATLRAADGVLIKGVDPNDFSGWSVSSAGDVDGDGLADILIGAQRADLDNSVDHGETYLVYGSALLAEKSGDGVLDLANLSPTDGVLIKGIAPSDYSGISVSSAGDVNADGLDDILIGAYGADPDGASSAGETYVLSGAELSAEKADDGIIALGDYWLV